MSRPVGARKVNSLFMGALRQAFNGTDKLKGATSWVHSDKKSSDGDVWGAQSTRYYDANGNGQFDEDSEVRLVATNYDSSNHVYETNDHYTITAFYQGRRISISNLGVDPENDNVMYDRTPMNECDDIFHAEVLGEKDGYFHGANFGNSDNYSDLQDAMAKYLLNGTGDEFEKF